MGLTQYSGMTNSTLLLEKNLRGWKAVWRQLEMTGHVRLHFTRLDRTLRDSVYKYSSNYRYCRAGQTSRLGLVGGVTSKHDYSECLWQQPRAASPSQSRPRHLSRSLSWTWEAKGKERSAAIIQLQYLWKNSLSDALKLQRAATLGLERLLSLTALQCWAHRFILHSYSR